MPVRPHLRRSAQAIVAGVRSPAFAPPGHFLSPLTGPDDIRRAIRRPDPVGIELGGDDQLRLVAELDLTVPRAGRYSTGPENQMFGPADAALLRGMLRRFRPRRMYEVGSGFSTAVALDLADDELHDLEITCVEPHPDRLLRRLRPEDAQRLTLHEGLVQDIAAADIAGELAPGDFLFIDSSHVCKAGSDVSHLILRTLPLLPEGVHVHVHDVFWPFEYPDTWLAERRDWNEAYVLQAFLTGNTRWRIELFGDWLQQCHPHVLPAAIRGVGTGSIWLRCEA